MLIVIITYASVQNPWTNQYISELKDDAATVTATMKDHDELRAQIKQFSETNTIPPINAHLDPVWKAIPGYNGLSVDQDASFNRMKKNKQFNEALIVYKQTKPKVSLEDLPASPIYKGNPEKPMVTFLVNVAWGNEYLTEILETMKKHKIHSTFFLDGSWVKKNQDLSKIIHEEGHEIGNHAYSHPDMKKLTNSRIKEEIQKTNDIIESTVHVDPIWFAPPSGSFRDDVVQIADTLNMKTILWSVDTVDWRNPDPDQMSKRVLSKVHPGAMILMHPTKSSASALEQMIEGIQQKGYTIGTVTQLMSEKRIVKSKKNPEPSN